MAALSRARAFKAVHLAARVSTVMKAAKTKTVRTIMDMIVSDNTKENPFRALSSPEVAGFT
jgi:hypothetical protein